MKKKEMLNIILTELFQISLITYLILLITETVKSSFVSEVFNLNILLGVVLISGIGKVLTEVENDNSVNTFTERVWKLFFKKVNTRRTAPVWQGLLKEIKVKKLISEDWSELYKDWYKDQRKHYWSFMETDLKFFFKDLKKSKLKESEFYFTLILSLGGGLLVYYKTQDLGGISLLISAITFLIIGLMSFLIFTDSLD